MILVLLVVNNFSAANLIASSAQVSAAIGTSVLVGVIASLLLFIQGTLSLFPSLIRPDSGRDASVETEGSNSNGGGELAILAPKATEQRKDVISIARAILQTIEGVCSVVVIEKAAGNRLLLEVGPLSKTALKDSDISSNTLTILQQITANDKITMIPFTDFITRCPDLAKKTSQSFNKEMQQIAIGRRSSHEDETNAMKDGAEEYWMVGLAKSSELTDNYNGVKKWLSSLLDSPTANNSTR